MEFIIRPATNKDAKEVYNLIHLDDIENCIFVMPDENINVFIENFSKRDSNIHKFVAVETSDEKRIIGFAELTVGELRSRNRAHLFMIVDPAIQKKGVGDKLLEAAVDTALNWLKLVRIEFNIYTDNFNAIEFFEKRGFEKEVLKQKSIIRNGQYIDEFIMAKVEFDQ